MKLILLPLLLITAGNLSAQQFLLTDTIGGIVVKKDSRLDALSAKQSEINKRAMQNSTLRTSGYRVQIINTQNRDDANKVKTDLLRNFPDQKIYLMYKAPNFRVRMGNFLTRADAELVRSQIAAMYPGRGIYLVADMIEYRPINEDGVVNLE